MSEHPHYPSHPDELAEQDAFKAARRDGLYSTDSAAILQLSRYGTPRSVYLDKTQPIPPSTPASLQAWLGWRLEDSLAQLYAERYGVPAPMRMPLTYTHMEPHLPFIKTHLDYVDMGGADGGGNVLVECKTRTWMTGWGEDGTGKVPPDVWVQCQHEMMVTGARLCRIAVLFGLHTFRVYELPADPTFQERLTQELERFWHEHVVAGVMPELTGLPIDQALVRNKPMTEDALASITADQERVLKRARMAALAVSQAKVAKDAADAQVIEMIGNRAGLMGRFGSVTYRPTKGTTSWELLAGTAMRGARKLLEVLHGIKEDSPEMWEVVDLVTQQLDAAPTLYTKPGTRTLRYSWAEGDD